MSQQHKGELLTAGWEATEQEYLRRAFELAYFIHADVGVALRITEAALSKLPHTFGKQDRRYHYVPGGRRQSQDRPSHALRMKVTLQKEHLLQLLVYAESDWLERCNEHSNNPDPLTDEDMVIRFIKYLVQITLKRNSFYVALGVGRLLYNYQTSQVGQIYDILMQDHARFRENAYLRKQKNALMQEIIERFDDMIRMVKNAQGEYRFETQPTTQSLISLVNECLHRYTPWDTTCVVPASFDLTERIPALSFSGTNPDQESPVEMNRIHTILDPDCFSRLVAGLGLESPESRLAVPQFFFSDNNEPRGDRFNPPPLTPANQRQLQRAREDSARRRKNYSLGQLRIYIDNVEKASFDPRWMTKVVFKCRPANVIEVRGRDSEGELPLATLLMSYENIPAGGSLRDSVVIEGGQRFTIFLTPNRSVTGETTEISIEMRYAETQPIRLISWLAQRAWLGLVETARGNGEVSQESKPGYSMIVKVGLTAVLIFSGAVMVAILWRQRQPAQRNVPAPQQVELAPAPAREPSPLISTPPAPVAPRIERASPSLIARATWSKDPEAVNSPVRIEARRSSVRSVEIPLTQTTQLIALNRADAEDRRYDRYRIVLVAAEKPIWQRILQAPKGSSTSQANVLRLELSPQRFPKADSYSLRVEGEIQGRWQALGEIMFELVSP